MKNLRQLACKFDLDQSERKSSQVNASARKPWPNGFASRAKFSTCVFLRVRLVRALVVTVYFFVSFPLHVVLEERQTAGEKSRSQMWKCYHLMRCNKIDTEMY